MKKIFLLLFFVLIYQNQLTAQIISPVKETYNINVTRSDGFAHNVPNIPGHAHTDINLFIKIGSNEVFKTFAKDVSSSTAYTFPIIYVIGGNPTPVKYVKVTFGPLSPLQSGYYPLTTTVGSHTTIPSEPSMINYNEQFGYGVDITCTAPNQYIMNVTRFECYICTPGGGTVSKQAVLQPKTALVDNSAMGISELYYTAAGKETISVSVIDIHGKTVRAYTTDIEIGLNKLPIDLQNYLGGIYLVKWKSSNGTNGTLKMVKK